MHDSSDKHLPGEAGDNSTEAEALSGDNSTETEALSPEQRQQEKNAAIIRLLQSWRESDDAAEQRETLAYLMRAIDEDRLSDRKLFP